MQYLLKVHGLMVKWIFMKHIFILSDSLSENFVRYIFIHFMGATWKYLEILKNFFLLFFYMYIYIGKEETSGKIL